MATVDTQLSALTSLTDLVDTDTFLVRRSTTDYKTTGLQIRKMAQKYGTYSGKINDINYNSVYVVSVSGSDSSNVWPVDSASYYIVETLVANTNNGTPNWIIQRAHSLTSSRLYTRMYANSQWYPWMIYADKDSVDYLTTLKSFESPSMSGLTFTFRRRGYVCEASINGTLNQDLPTGGSFIDFIQFNDADTTFCKPGITTIRYMQINARTSAQIRLTTSWISIGYTRDLITGEVKGLTTGDTVLAAWTYLGGTY